MATNNRKRKIERRFHLAMADAWALIDTFKRIQERSDGEQLLMRQLERLAYRADSLVTWLQLYEASGGQTVHAQPALQASGVDSLSTAGALAPNAA